MPRWASTGGWLLGFLVAGSLLGRLVNGLGWPSGWAEWAAAFGILVVVTGSIAWVATRSGRLVHWLAALLAGWRRDQVVRTLIALRGKGVVLRVDGTQLTLATLAAWQQTTDEWAEVVAQEMDKIDPVAAGKIRYLGLFPLWLVPNISPQHEQAMRNHNERVLRLERFLDGLDSG